VQDEWRSPPCHQSGPRLSWSYGALQSFSPTALATPIGYAAPLLSLASPLDSRVFARSATRLCQKQKRISSPELPPSFRELHSPSCRRHETTTEVAAPLYRLLPWGSFPFSVSPPGAAASIDRASHGPIACASRFSQPPGALVRPEPAGLVSCQIRSWGSPFRALLLSCSRSPSPASLPSCRWTTLPSSPRTPQSSRAPKRRAESGRPPCGEGFVTTLAFRALLHTRVRHPVPVV
jgi:hypothetical protein